MKFANITITTPEPGKSSKGEVKSGAKRKRKVHIKESKSNLLKGEYQLEYWESTSGVFYDSYALTGPSILCNATRDAKVEFKERNEKGRILL